MDFFELVTIEPVCGLCHYYYFYPIEACHPKSLKFGGSCPDKLRMLIEDRNETPLYLTRISFFQYIKNKYLRKATSRFYYGKRINWEKEEL